MNSSEQGDRYEKRLRERRESQRLRILTPVETGPSKTTIRVNERNCINFCSNDYLGLSGHPDVIAGSVDYAQRYGTGSASSRLVSGSLSIAHELEEKIAALYSREETLLFGSGFQANISLLPALAGRGDLILADKRVHNSLIQGGLLSRATFQRFRHNDCEHLEAMLKRFRSNHPEATVWVVTESLFSMDGDRAPLGVLQHICRRYGARLYVDDAHAFGVLGDRGLGLAAGHEGVDLILGTMGKAGGSYGAFVICSQMLKQYLVNECSGVIYSTGPSPVLIGAVSAAFDLIPHMHKERKRLSMLSHQLRSGLMTAGFRTGLSDSHIIPVLLEDESRALQLASQLLDEKLFAQAIRPPAVEQSRLRLTLTAMHTRMETDRLLEVIDR